MEEKSGKDGGEAKKGEEEEGGKAAGSDAAAAAAAAATATTPSSASPAPAGSGIIQEGECGHEESLPWSMAFDPTARHVERCYTEKSNVEKDVAIGAMSEKRMKLHMAAKGTCIDWRFETAKNDIRFGWEFVPYDAGLHRRHRHDLDMDVGGSAWHSAVRDDARLTPLSLPAQRFSSQLFPIRGSFECPVPGELTLYVLVSFARLPSPPLATTHDRPTNHHATKLAATPASGATSTPTLPVKRSPLRS